MLPAGDDNPITVVLGDSCWVMMTGGNLQIKSDDSFWVKLTETITQLRVPTIPIHFKADCYPWNGTNCKLVRRVIVLVF